MKTYWTADLHIGHANVRVYEPGRMDYLNLNEWSTTEDHDEAIVALWNVQVGPEDCVVIVGDLAMGKIDQTLATAKRLNGTKFLVPGNHDRMHPMEAKSQEKRDRWTDRYESEAGVFVAGIEFTCWIEDVEVKVNHFPYSGDHKETDRGVEYRPSVVPFNYPLIHGHVHSLWRTKGNQFNVGLDAWNGRLIPDWEIADYFRSL